jgi:DNA (cytosine-5)-methyltransferase 1
MFRVIDVFAGPGGLGEGFASLREPDGSRTFDVDLSVEKDPFAYQTLKLRSFFRQFEDGLVPEEYYRSLRGELPFQSLYDKFPLEHAVANGECWEVTLGPRGISPDVVRQRIQATVGADVDWVLIGGPPCQAYSLAGRSRNLGVTGYDPKKDVRQRLYIEYLQVLADHRPAVFVMENVKGLLSATLGQTGLFHRILEDLRDPRAAILRERRTSHSDSVRGYRIWSLSERRHFDNGNVEGSVICSERYGIPQARHRVILLGIRDDITSTPDILKPEAEMTVRDAIHDLPVVRSGLSRTVDSGAAWRHSLRSQVGRRWANAGTFKAGGEAVYNAVQETLRTIEPPLADRGREFVRGVTMPARHANWYFDRRLDGFCNHSSRSHMESDLHRYLYAACFADKFGRSPNLREFPTDLRPDHASADVALEEGGNFSDRFRVQVTTRPSTTIMSHISKDGHYYIHPDARQCRSMTVREAARLQTFPDNYFFCGPRTAQYTQVGNAVPPLLSRKIAAIVADVLRKSGGID